MNKNTMSMEDAQDRVRAGRVRIRAFGETSIYGASTHHDGDLDKAADNLPTVLESGLCKLYMDEGGLCNERSKGQ